MATHDLTANGDSTGQAQERSLQERGRRLGVYLISPLVLTLTFIFAFPTVMIFYLAFSFWGPLDGVSWLMAHQSLNWFVNFGDIFRDAALWGSIWRTLLIMLVVVPTEFMIGLGLAMLFVRSFPGKPLFYSILLLPMMVVPAVTGYMFFMLFQAAGPINQMVRYFTGLDAEWIWLGDPVLSMIAVMLADIWQWTPLMFLILLAGMLGVPVDQMRAATLLGANWGQLFTRIVLPKMKIVMAIAIVIRAVEAFKLFDVMWIMTRGGPGVSTETISVFIYKMTFFELEWSYVAAIGLIILVMLTVLALLGMNAMTRAQKRRMENLIES